MPREKPSLALDCDAFICLADEQDARHELMWDCLERGRETGHEWTITATALAQARRHQDSRDPRLKAAARKAMTHRAAWRIFYWEPDTPDEIKRNIGLAGELKQRGWLLWKEPRDALILAECSIEQNSHPCFPGQGFPG